MNKSINNILALGVIAFCLFLLPVVADNYFVEKKTETFYQRVDEDFADCVENERENANNVDWCKKIKKSSELSFKSATRASDKSLTISITQSVLFVLAAMLLILKRKVENFENK